ncbi:MAG TPA: peptidoglycan bridge formation glycyltransferase FemA/FemB family protein [Cytophagaceae bacterium]
MKVNLYPIAINDLVASPILQQTSYWGHVKKMHGLDVLAFRIEADPQQEGYPVVTDDILIITRQVASDLSYAYVPYGPEKLPHEDMKGVYLEEISEALRPFLPSNCVYIRYDLPWPSPWINEDYLYDEEGQWAGPPEPRVRELRMNFGTREWRLRKAPSDVLPSSTFFIDIGGRERRSKEGLLKRMKPKTRYNINLAKRKGVRVREAGREKLRHWYRLHLETAQRNKIIFSKINYFESLLEAKALSPQTKVHLLMAEVEEKPLAGMFLVMNGGRATYLYGASSGNGRNYMSSYALQWEAICKAMEEGCHQYDMFGVSPGPNPAHPMYGLYRFKSGFGGRFYHRKGCWDYVLNEALYGSYIAAELSSGGYHIA